MNRIKVVICGKEYFLKTEDDATYIYNLARALDKKINLIMDTANVSAQSACVMVALSMLDDLKTTDDELTLSKQKILDMQDDRKKLLDVTAERNSALEEVKRLNVRIKELENTIRLKDMGNNIPENTNKSKK